MRRAIAAGVARQSDLAGGTVTSRALVERYIDMVGLGRFADAFPHQLFGDMTQHVAVARVFANDAKVVLIDEPFGALDAMSCDKF